LDSAPERDRRSTTKKEALKRRGRHEKAGRFLNFRKMVEKGKPRKEEGGADVGTKDSR